MIGIVGRMSGGKTYYAVECIRDWLMHGHIVCTNIKLNCRGVSAATHLPCVIWKQLYFYLSDEPSGYHHLAQGDYNSYPVGSPRGSSDYDSRLVYIVLDEVSSVFDSMTHASDGGIQAVATWARHTEKRGQSIYLIMQFASELHKRLRVHITSFVSCVNTNTIKIPVLGWPLPGIFRGFILRQQYLQDGETPIGNSQWLKINPIIYRMYDTSQIVYGAHMGRKYDFFFSSDSIHQHQERVSVLWSFGLLLTVQMVCLLALLLQLVF